MQINSLASGTQDPLPFPRRGPGTDPAKPLRPLRTFKGHGMLEQYPANLTLAYVSAHERRHANKNRSEAGREGGVPDQNISYSVQISPGGRLRATGGLTSSRGVVRKKQRPAPFSGPRDGTEPLSPESRTRRLQETRLASKKESLEKSLREKGASPMDSNGDGAPLNEKGTNDPLSGLTAKKSNDLSKNIEKVNLRRKISLVDREQNRLSTQEARQKSLRPSPAAGAEAENSTAEAINRTPVPQEDHVDISRVAPAAYFFAQRKSPDAIFTNGFGSAHAINRLLGLTDQFNPQGPVPKNARLELTAAGQKIKDLNALGGNFNKLGAASSELRSPGSFNVRVARSSFPEAVSADTTAGTPPGRYRVAVSSLAQPDKIVSDPFADSFAALGLSGSFKINGFQVDVTSSDSLNSLKDKINFGEDTNKNGRLDFAEDLNGNGVVDVIQIKGAGGGNDIFIFEDINFNGTLDPTEDGNGNGSLDGGTAQIGARADLEHNRLVIHSVKTGNNRLSVDDTNGILLNLGFLFKFSTGDVVTKNQNDSATGAPFNSLPSPAQFSLNGADLESASNTVNGAIPDTTLRLKQAASATLDIKTDIAPSRKKIETFSKAYNDSVTSLNNFLAFKKSLPGNAVLQRIRAQLQDRARRPVKDLPEGANSLASLGLDLRNTEKNAPFAFSLGVAVKAALNNKKAVSIYRAQGDHTLFAELRQRGIKTLQDDNLKIKDQTLSKKLEASPVDAAGVFMERGDGIAARLDNFLRDVLKSGGTLDLEKERIAARATGTAKTTQTLKGVVNGRASIVSSNFQTARLINAFA